MDHGLPATNEQLEVWLAEAREAGVTHLMIVHEPGSDAYPIFVASDNKISEVPAGPNQPQILSVARAEESFEAGLHKIPNGTVLHIPAWGGWFRRSGPCWVPAQAP